MAKPSFLGSLPAPLPRQTLPLAALPNPVCPTHPKSYPLLVPRLKPSIIRKMQIGSGVSFSPLSLFNPPSTASDSYILE
jgi:hypothetical protein